MLELEQGVLERHSPLLIVLLVELVEDGLDRELPRALLVVRAALVEVPVVADELGHDWEEPVEVPSLSPQGVQVEGEEEVVTDLLTHAPMVGHPLIQKKFSNKFLS
jgi:hypothetical protein